MYLRASQPICASNLSVFTSEVDVLLVCMYYT